MELDRKGVSPVIGTILLIAVTVILVGVVAAFALGLGAPKKRPVASLKIEDEVGPTGKLLLKHEGGDEIYWKDIEIAVVKGKDNAITEADYVDPPDVIDELDTETGDLSVGESVHIIGTTKDGSVKVFSTTEDNWFHIIIKHIPSDSIVYETNARLSTA